MAGICSLFTPSLYQVSFRIASESPTARSLLVLDMNLHLELWLRPFPPPPAAGGRLWGSLPWWRQRRRSRRRHGGYMWATSPGRSAITNCRASSRNMLLLRRLRLCMISIKIGVILAFVTMSTVGDANVAIEKLNDTEIGGRKIKINVTEKALQRVDMSLLQAEDSTFIDSPHKVYVGNFTKSVTSELLSQFFSENGKVLSAKVS